MYLWNSKNSITNDALVDSAAYVGAIAQNKLNRTKEPVPNNIFNSDDLTHSQVQVVNVQMEKPLATATLTFDVGDDNFVEHSVVVKKLTGPIIGLHFLRHNTLAVDTTHGLILFPHLTKQVKRVNPKVISAVCFLLYKFDIKNIRDCVAIETYLAKRLKVTLRQLGAKTQTPADCDE